MGSGQAGQRVAGRTAGRTRPTRRASNNNVGRGGPGDDDTQWANEPPVGCVVSDGSVGNDLGAHRPRCQEAMGRASSARRGRHAVMHGRAGWQERG